MIDKAIDPARTGLSKSLMTTEERVGLADRLMERGRREGRCLVWTGARNDRGYGQTTHQGRVVYVHRLAFEAAYGQNPGELYVCHSCDNPPCFEPLHLFAGTNSDNQLDAAAKGRKRFPRKLSPKVVAAIRTMRGRQRDIADEFGISQSLVSRIKSGERWAV